MKCAVHTEVDAGGFCRNCGKALCGECTRNVRGVLYCEDCLTILVSKPQAAPGSRNPALAAVLGLIPGLGAVYNQEFMKALVHVMIFAGLVTFLEGGHARGYEPFFGMMIPTFIFYMSVDAYRSAKARGLGQVPPTSLPEFGANAPVGPALLIAVGFLFLLNNLGWLSIGRILDFWPVALIVIGVLMLRKRMQQGS